MPHRLDTLFDPRRDEAGPNCDAVAGRLPLERFAGDDVLPFADPRVALPLDDVAREDDLFDVEDADFVIV